jgi:bifunctional non-homologous end joining protein LigD
MDLTEYKRKRNFRRTPEPAGNGKPRRKNLYVIQKHDASRLHYDFRLELDGTLKSWAVPKGPSLDPSVKSLAVQVEDHPLSYADFEGIIPEGEYGGGTVMVWDQGTWDPEGDASQGYKRGKLSFVLHGEKLKGKWSLVQMGGRAGDGGKNWLLIKADDRSASKTKDIRKTKPKSVLSGRELDEIAEAQDRVWGKDGASKNGKAVVKHSKSISTRSRAPSNSKPARKRKRKSNLDAKKIAALAGKLPNARKRAPRQEFKPQLATLGTAVPPGDGWLHEMKFDGYRLLAFCANGKVRLITRNGNDWTKKFPSITDELASLPLATGIMDGEVVYLNKKGISNFQMLQNMLKRGNDDSVCLYLFDLPFCGAFDLTETPLINRKELLSEILLSANSNNDSRVRYSDHIVGQGTEVLANACHMGLEGVVSKRVDGPYIRSRDPSWAKTKCLQRQEFVIGGFTKPTGSRVGFGALMLGYYDKGKLVYAGRVGTGFDTASLRQIHRELKKLKNTESPFDSSLTSAQSRGVIWVKPKLVGEVEFTEWTNEGLLRHPSFQGLREDKPAKQIIRERAVPVSKLAKSAAKGNRHSEPEASDGTVEVAGVSITHPDRVLYPEQGLTKLGLAEYYEAISEWILPYVANRPLTLVRCPQGHKRHCFFQKHLSDAMPDTLRGVMIKEKEEEGEYVVLDDLAGLISLVQLGVLEVHPWGAKADAVESPDQIVFDLDPGPGVPWQTMIEAGRAVRDRIAQHKLKSFVRTSGGKGLHIVIPLKPASTWDSIKEFAKEIAHEMQHDDPGLYIAKSTKAKRNRRIFVDYLRNSRGATSVASYSTRARQGAPVAVPLRWEELGKLESADQYTVANVVKRLSALRKDPWDGFFRIKQTV